mgnify:CR=1 FL=1|jgi:hypothetical protein
MIERIETVYDTSRDDFTEKLGRLVEQMQHDNLTVEIQYSFAFTGFEQQRPQKAFSALVIGKLNNG